MRYDHFVVENKVSQEMRRNLPVGLAVHFIVGLVEGE